uniref:Fibronectin type-III domain-containing protein n=1 Tax=Timema bartmani TaxID=61472 RepID=A0A7R9IAB5_9NEOP|nr:unnamed protein product [Timema bartmani]
MRVLDVGKLFTAPKSARNLAFSFANATSIVAEWEAPSDQSECLDYYQACLVVAGKTVCVNQTRDITTAYIPDLRSCTSYAVDITAWTDGARSSVLSEQVDTTAADSVNARQGSLEVRSAADEANGTPHIHEVTDKTDSKRTVLQSLLLEMCASNRYSAQHPVPRPLIHHYDRVNPHFSAIQGINPKGPQLIPDVPNHLHVNYAETGLLNVQWRVPTVNYECVQGYIVCWRSSGDQAEGCLNTTNLEQVITGLTPCTNYSINITAVGAIGASQTAHMSAHTRSQGKSTKRDVNRASPLARVKPLREEEG